MLDRKKIGLREVRALQPGEIAWDAAVAGFGARRQKGAVAYVLKYRTAGGRQRWFTIGRHGAPWTPDMARDEAVRLLGLVASGGDPATDKGEARRVKTVSELCAAYMEDAEAGRILVRGGKPKKPLTLASDRGRIDGHIIPLLGRMSVAAVTKKDVEHFMHAVGAGESAKGRSPQKTKPRGVSKVTGGRGVATRTVGLLGAIFQYAVDHHMRTDNPAHRVRKFAENRRNRRLSDGEYELLGKGLQAALEPNDAGKVEIWPHAVACLRFLALTGWRSGEAVALRWGDVNLATRTARLRDTKTGESVRPLSLLACAVLRGQGAAEDAALVFPATRQHVLMVGFKKFARRIVAKAGLPADVTPHVLRHSFASLAADLGFSEVTIGALIGHKGLGITGRYIHSADAVLLAAADAVATETDRRMDHGADAPR